MPFKTRQIKGKGRGKLLGFPTINLAIPKDFNYKEGIYAAWVTIEGKSYMGALHFGPVPTFNEEEKKLEVFLINGSPTKMSLSHIIIDLVKRTRGVKKFKTAEELVSQMKKDVKAVYNILKHG